jgi:DNA primase
VYARGGYGFAVRDGIEIHLGLVANPETHGRAGAYLFVDDADTLAEMWRSAGVEVHQPEDTEGGQHEGAVVDPDGNVIRFGSPMRTPEDS